MRYSRQTKIIQLIEDEIIGTQEQLINRLTELGYSATQATVSRDINELQLVKRTDENGIKRYVRASSTDNSISGRFIRIFRDTMVSYNSAKNLIIVKTLSGCGNAAAEAIDCMNLKHIVGSVAGDNTLLLVIEDDKYVPEIVKKFDEMVNS